MARFFVSGAIGFEERLIAEIRSVWFLMSDLDGLPTRAEFPEMTVIEGGVEFETDLHLGLQLNYFSKQAFRVLLRVGRFPARFYDQLEKQLAQINFTAYFALGSSLQFKASFSKSRINNEKNVLEACGTVFTKKGYKISENAPQTLFLRIAKDQVEVSIDSTGEHLHFRGYRKHQGEAPLRENLAALLWSYMPDDIGSEDIVLDPFCGSGTLIFEHLIKSLPNFTRSYAFLAWPNCPAIMKSPTFSKNFRWMDSAREFAQYIGCDISSEVINKAKANLSLLQTQFSLKVQVQWSVSSCRDLRFQKGRRLFVVANPPYGERLNDHGAMDDLGVCFAKNSELFSGIDALILQPLGRVPEFKNLQLRNKIPFTNQGLKLSLLHYSADST